MDCIRMQHLGPGWAAGKWIMIISQLEQQKHTQVHRLVSVHYHHIISISGKALWPVMQLKKKSLLLVFFWRFLSNSYCVTFFLYK